jgi:REP element-mobilizing transposase RayT
MPNYHIPLQPEHHYHIFSRAVGAEKLFLNDENYRYFLHKLNEHISSVASLWAYCLIPNHFHLLVEIKSESDIKLAFEKAKKSKTFQPELISDFVMERFSNCLNAYTKAFNKQNKRQGALFMNYLRRVEMENDSQFTSTLFYVHKNPVHHGLVKEIGPWKWSSFPAYLSEAPTKLKRNEGLEWFGGQEEFIKFHNQPIDLKGFDEPD